jgi:hypothetical protein
MADEPTKADKPRRKQHEYTDKVGRRICERIACGERLKDICDDPDMPTTTSVRRWVVNDVDGFAERYMRARRLQADWYADEIVTLADSATREDVQKVPLQVDSRRWGASTLLPRIYGPTQRTEITGADGGPIKTESFDFKGMSDDDLFALRDILTRHAAAAGEDQNGGGSTSTH